MCSGRSDASSKAVIFVFEDPMRRAKICENDGAQIRQSRADALLRARPTRQAKSTDHMQTKESQHI